MNLQQFIRYRGKLIRNVISLGIKVKDPHLLKTEELEELVYKHWSVKNDNKGETS